MGRPPNGIPAGLRYADGDAVRSRGCCGGGPAGAGRDRSADIRSRIDAIGWPSIDENLVNVVDAYRGDAIVWDIGVALDDGVERLAELADALPPIVALLGDAGIAGQAWAAGARALLHRDVTPGRLAAAVHAAVEGVTVLDDAFADVLCGGPSSRWHCVNH